MNAPAFSTEQRRQLLDRYDAVRRDLSGPFKQQFTIQQLQEKARERDALLAEYAERLPFVPVSRCPFCVEPLEYALDANGLDGPWWFKDALAKYPPPNACPHFRVLLGAIDFKQPKTIETRGIREILPGPGVPFVVPRLLTGVPGMKAVISSLNLPPGFTAYLIAYFSEKPVDAALLHQPWARQAYDVFDEQGKFKGWRSANDTWDFDLQPWIDKGLLLWINPGDSALTLQHHPPCPYVNLPGVRAYQKVVRGNLETQPPPTGQPLAPFE
ncbi:MAG TPA: hypothetical protein VG167_09405 [Verrucomicrobiae bacterium]|nr:hypothetical protein [Verrucomicrobiae bacterium]